MRQCTSCMTCYGVGPRLIYANSINLEFMPRKRVEMSDARFEGDKSYQIHVVSVRVHILNEVDSSTSSVRTNGGAIACVVELMSRSSYLPDHAPNSSQIRSCSPSNFVASREIMSTLQYAHPALVAHRGSDHARRASRNIRRVIQRERWLRPNAQKAHTDNIVHC